MIIQFLTIVNIFRLKRELDNLNIKTYNELVNIIKYVMKQSDHEAFFINISAILYLLFDKYNNKYSDKYLSIIINKRFMENIDYIYKDDYLYTKLFYNLTTFYKINYMFNNY